MCRAHLLLSAVIFSLGTLAIPQARCIEPASQPVKLVVLVVFDQLRGDFVEKWQPHFGTEGFVRMQEHGTWFSECHYPYAITATGPGHAAMLTGTSPWRNGIIGNSWYSRQSAAEAYCAGSTRYSLVRAVTPAENTAQQSNAKPKLIGTPEPLLAESVADVLKASTKGQGKVIGVSFKDRGAILPAGQKPDGAYWYSGGFVTSTYYRDTLPKWVADFNASGTAESYFGKTWDRFKPELDYEALVGPDLVPAEGNGSAQGKTLPHVINGGKDKNGQLFTNAKAAGSKYYDALYNSPFGNELLLAFAETALVEEQLGADDTPDLLSISFSSNDSIGHCWGPDSHEVFDTTLRSDVIMAKLLKTLDDKVGVGQYAVILTADHGICPLPEVAANQGLEAQRVSATQLLTGAEKQLATLYDSLLPEEQRGGKWIEAPVPPYLYLNHKKLAAAGVEPSHAADALAKWLREQEGLQAVYTAKQLSTGAIDRYDTIGQKVLKAFHPERSGDVFLVLKPFHLIGSVSTNDKLATGTNHGSPHAYDTHVPLIVFGPGATSGKTTEPVAPQHAATIAAHYLGIALPKHCEVTLPQTLLPSK